MQTRRADILSADVLKGADAVGVTTNGEVRRDGKAVMGAGVAKAFRDRFKGIDEALAESIWEHGNAVRVVRFIQDTQTYIFSFPTKGRWKDPATLELIARSASQLVDLADAMEWRTIWLPRPGCDNGGLDWIDVEPVLDRYLDDRFTICYL